VSRSWSNVGDFPILVAPGISRRTYPAHRLGPRARQASIHPRWRALNFPCGLRRIENGSHYVRDVACGEDASRIHKNPDIVARIRSFAYNLIRETGCQNIKNAR